MSSMKRQRVLVHADQAISQSDSENEDRMLSKIVNMKKKFSGSYTSTTSKEANQTKR